MQPATFAHELTHEMLSAEQHQAHPRLLVVLAIGICSPFGLLGVYTSERILLTHVGGLRAEGGATCREAQLLEGSRAHPPTSAQVGAERLRYAGIHCTCTHHIFRN